MIIAAIGAFFVLCWYLGGVELERTARYPQHREVDNDRR